MWISEGSRKSKVEELKAGKNRRSVFPFTDLQRPEGLRLVSAIRLLYSALRSLTPDTRHLTPAFCLLLSAWCLLPAAYCLAAARGLYEVREVQPNVFVWIADDVLDPEGDPQFNRAGNAGFIITTEGVVVVNTTNTPFHARELLYEIRRRTDLPVRYVINTDSQGDHMLGNEVFVDQQATIVSTNAAQAEMRQYGRELLQRLKEDEHWRLQGRMRGIHPTLPSQVFDPEMSIRLGGQEIKLLSLSGGHSAGDAVVHLPGAKLLFLGHLYENGFFPHLASSDVRRWIEILRQMESWDVETYLPAHGPPGDKKQLGEFRQFLEWLVAEVQARIQQGKSLNEVRRELNPAEIYHWSARDLAPRAVEAVYRQLEETQPAP
jgi:glyoxylase-like metal-dependent hydrolase (beta-lactamase superfamily II)